MYDVPDILPMLNRIIEQAPEGYVYNETTTSPSGRACFYWHHEENRPSCIVGHLLEYLGVLGPIKNSHIANTVKIGTLWEQYPVIADLFTNRAKRFLEVLQFQQDNKITWAQALMNAIEFDKTGVIPKINHVERTGITVGQPPSHLLLKAPITTGFFSMDEPVKVQVSNVNWRWDEEPVKVQVSSVNWRWDEGQIKINSGDGTSFLLMKS